MGGSEIIIAPQSVQLRNQHAREMIKRIEEYYAQGVFQYHRRYADYVTLRVGTETYTAPASSALLVAQCAARDMQFTGKVAVEYRLDANGNPCCNEFCFTNGVVTNVNRFCGYSIYGQDLILRKVGIAC